MLINTISIIGCVICLTEHDLAIIKLLHPHEKSL